MGQAVAVHLRHFGIGDHQQDLVGHLLASIAPPLEQGQRLQTILTLDHLKPKLAQGLAHQIASGAGVIDDQHFAAMHLGQDLPIQHLFGDADVIGDDLRQHLLHIDDLDDLIHSIFGNAGDGGEVVGTPGRARWRQDILPGHVDDVGHLPHQKALNGAVVLGDDEVGFTVDGHGTHADGAAQVDHRDRGTADIGHPADIVMGARHLAQMGQFDHFPYLEDVDGEHLTGAETKHQQLEAVFPHQLSSLINGIQYTRHTLISI